jgi:hypothetical protein
VRESPLRNHIIGILEWLIFGRLRLNTVHQPAPPAWSSARAVDHRQANPGLDSSYDPHFLIRVFQSQSHLGPVKRRKDIALSSRLENRNQPASQASHLAWALSSFPPLSLALPLGSQEGLFPARPICLSTSHQLQGHQQINHLKPQPQRHDRCHPSPSPSLPAFCMLQGQENNVTIHSDLGRSDSKRNNNPQGWQWLPSQSASPAGPDQQPQGPGSNVMSCPPPSVGPPSPSDWPC